MKKAVVAVAITGVVAAGYFGAVKYTGDQAHQMTLNMLADMERSPHYRELFTFETDSSKEFFGSHYQITLNAVDADLQRAMTDMTGSAQITFDTRAEYGLFSADYRTVLAQSELLSRLKGVQQNARTEPLLSDTRITINPLSAAPEITSTTRLDALRLARNGKVFEMAASESLATLKDRQYVVDATVGALQMTESGVARLVFDGISLKQTATLEAGSSLLEGLFEAIDAEVQIGKLEGDNHKGTQLSMQPSQIRVKQSKAEDRVELTMAWDLGATRVAERDKGEVLNLRSAALDFTLNLDSAAYNDVTRQMNEMQPAQLENPFLLMGLLSKVTEKGIKFGLNRFNIVMEEGQFEAGGALDVKGFSLHQTLQNPDLMRKQVAANVSLALDEALVEKLPKARQRAQLEEMVQRGFILKKDSQLTTQLQIENGQIMVNGIPMGNI